MSNLFSPSPCAMVIYGLYCSMKEMIKKEDIFKVTHKLTPKATILRKGFVKARDVAHATRIANNLFRIVENVEFACEDNLN